MIVKDRLLHRKNKCMQITRWPSILPRQMFAVIRFNGDCYTYYNDNKDLMSWSHKCDFMLAPYNSYILKQKRFLNFK